MTNIQGQRNTGKVTVDAGKPKVQLVTAESQGSEPYFADKYKALLPAEDIQGEGHYLNYINNHPSLPMNRFPGWGTYGSMFKRGWLDGPPPVKNWYFKIENEIVTWHSIGVEARFEREAREMATDTLNERMTIRQRQPPLEGWSLRLTEVNDV